LTVESLDEALEDWERARPSVDALQKAHGGSGPGRKILGITERKPLL